MSKKIDMARARFSGFVTFEIYTNALKEMREETAEAIFKRIERVGKLNKSSENVVIPIREWVKIKANYIEYAGGKRK